MTKNTKQNEEVSGDSSEDVAQKETCVKTTFGELSELIKGHSQQYQCQVQRPQGGK